MITLRELLARVEARKAELGMIDTPAATEAMRNKGSLHDLFETAR